MCKTGRCAAVWGDRLQVGQLEEINMWPLVGVSVRAGGRHQFAHRLSASKQDGQGTLLEGDAALLGDSEDAYNFRERNQRPGLLQVQIESPHAAVPATPWGNPSRTIHAK